MVGRGGICRVVDDGYIQSLQRLDVKFDRG